MKQMNEKDIKTTIPIVMPISKEVIGILSLNNYEIKKHLFSLE